MKITVEKNRLWQQGSMFAIQDMVDGKLHLGKIVMEEFDPSCMIVGSEYEYQITDSHAQSLVDSLYEAGYRPSAASGSAGQLSAISNHLEDMRKLVFKEAI